MSSPGARFHVVASLLALVAACSSTEPETAPHRVATTSGSAIAVSGDERTLVATHRTDGVVSILRLNPNRGPADAIEPVADILVHPLNRSQPWAAVIGPDGDTAYVLLRGLGEVMRVTGLKSSEPREAGRVPVGADPTAIVISPSGRRLYVANFADGTISAIVTSEWNSGREGVATWDLNLRLARTGLLGPLLESDGGVWTEPDLQRNRPGLAHPRALAMTDDGDEDDDDEILYATEFFSQPISTSEVQDPDLSRQGFVYPIVLGIGAGNPPPDAAGDPIDFIALAPVPTGFPDARDEATHCFPNQLYGAAVHGQHLLVTSMCASPKAPVEAGPSGSANNFKTLYHPSIFSIDTRKQQELPDRAMVLTRVLEDRYESDAADSEIRRMPLIPNDLTIGPELDGQVHAYVTAFGASAVFPVGLDGTGLPDDVGATGARYISLGDAALPVAISTLKARPWALVLNDRKPELTLVDLKDRKNYIVGAAQSGWDESPDIEPDELVSDDAREGRRLFATGLGAWSLDGQGWSSCEACHPDGQSDGVTWQFARGPRRTISTAGTYHGSDTTPRILLWSANADEVHDIEAVARNVSGGVGGVVWNPYASQVHKDCRLLYDGKQPSDVRLGGSDECEAPKRTNTLQNGLNGSLAALTACDARTSSCDEETALHACEDDASICEVNGSRDWDRIDAFIRTVQTPHVSFCENGPTSGCVEEDGIAVMGRDLFMHARCAVCHGGPSWTRSRRFYEPGPDANGELGYQRPELAPDDRSAMLGALRMQRFEVPDLLRRVLGVSLSDDGTAPFRPGPALDATADEFLDYFYPPAGTAAPLDQINCVLRSVGTFPQGCEDPEACASVVPEGAPSVAEARWVLDGSEYAAKLAIGQTGFNIPSLVGLATGAPYFHAGNARTLEELFDPVFASHHAAIVPDFRPTKNEVRALVSFLLSIDENQPSDEANEDPDSDMAPDLCSQFE